MFPSSAFQDEDDSRQYCEEQEITSPSCAVFQCGWTVNRGCYRRVPTIGEGKKESPHYSSPMSFTLPQAHLLRFYSTSRDPSFQCMWCKECISFSARFSVLNDWATFIRTDHDANIVHGDLTPESVGIVRGRGFLNKARQDMSLDPGLKKLPYDDAISNARWAATELFRMDEDDPRPTKMSDVYSFGCLMLQMLTGRMPYCGTRRPEQVVYLKYLGREPIDAQTPKIPDRYIVFMRRCWSREPEKRPTMESVISFLREEIMRLEDQRGDRLQDS